MYVLVLSEAPIDGPPMAPMVSGLTTGGTGSEPNFCQGATAGGDCTVGSPTSLEAVATANSGALLDNQTHQVPEPASLAIFGAALAGLGLIRRRRKNV